MRRAFDASINCGRNVRSLENGFCVSGSGTFPPEPHGHRRAQRQRQEQRRRRSDVRFWVSGSEDQVQESERPDPQLGPGPEHQAS